MGQAVPVRDLVLLSLPFLLAFSGWASASRSSSCWSMPTIDISSHTQRLTYLLLNSGAITANSTPSSRISSKLKLSALERSLLGLSANIHSVSAINESQI